MAAGCLHSSLAEMLVAVGMDMDSGLHPLHSDSENPTVERIFYERYEPQVLAAISRTTASFPLSQMQQDWRYPPSEMNPHRRRGLGIESPFSLTKRKRMSRRFSTLPVESVTNRRQSRKPSAKPTTPAPEVAISSEVVNSLPTLCFPEGAFVMRQDQEEQVHYQVLTDVMGARTYATCLTLYRPFIAKGCNSDEMFSLTHVDTDVDLEENEIKCYVPVGLVLISKYPYFTVMKDCLSTILPLIKINPEELSSYLKDLAIRVTMTPVPPAGKLALSFDLFGTTLLLHPSDYPNKPVMDVPLQCAFFCFTPEVILKVIACLLTMQRIVFLSRNYALLTVISESFLAFILPFQWRFTYVPVLPDRLLELIDAPGTFIFGCHASHQLDVEQVEGLVMVNIDDGTIHICETIECSIPDIPSQPAETFKTVCQRAKLHYELEAVKTPTPRTPEEALTSQKRHSQQFHHEILTASLELMVNLLREVTLNLNIKKSFFNKESFLQSQGEEDRQFYQELLKTDMFNHFLRARLQQKQDYWTAMEEKTRSVIRRSIGMVTDKGEKPIQKATKPPKIIMDQLHVRPSVLLYTRRRSSQISLLPSSTNLDLDILTLPCYIQDGGPHFWERAVQEFNKKVAMSRSPGMRASSLYLRGMLNLALGHPLESLNDFHSLSAHDVRLHPSGLVEAILAHLTDQQRAELKDSPDYKKYLYSRKGSVGEGDFQVIQTICEVVPEEDVSTNVDPGRFEVGLHTSALQFPSIGCDDFQTFEEKIQLAEIAGDRDTILRLFEALTVGKTAANAHDDVMLDKETFQLFYECWKENEEYCLSLSIPDDMLDLNEGVLKVSTLIKTDSGTGRLMLTSKRLFYIQQGSDTYVEVARLRNVSKLEKIQVNSFLMSVDAVKIHFKDPSQRPFLACLKEDRNCWYLLIKEMWSGLIIADELKDPGIIQQAALNVLLLDAVIRSGNESIASHHQFLESSAQGLCHFTKKHEVGDMILSPDTREILQHRLNPSIRETERAAVEVLLYTPGHNSEERGPKLWCGVSSGKVKVYDASTWLLESEIQLTEQRVVALVDVGDTSVWAGSLDGVIYVIDVTSKTCNQRLTEHYHMISCIISSPDKRLIYSASVNGLIIIWMADQLLKLRHIQLENIYSLRSIQVIDNNIWCGVKDDIRIISQSGEDVRRIKYRVDNRVVELDCFLVTNDKQIWTGCSRHKQMVVWEAETYDIMKVFDIECKGFSKMVLIGNKIWAGSKGGYLYIFDHHSLQLERRLRAHDDAIRSMTTAMDQYIISGAGGQDGKVAIWRTSAMLSSSSSAEMEA